jgi:hypothetical protein
MPAETPVPPPPRLGRGALWAITAGVAAVCWLGGLVLVVAALVSEVVTTAPGEDPGSRFGQPLFVAAGVVLALGVAAVVVGTILGFRSPRASVTRPGTPAGDPAGDPAGEPADEPSRDEPTS